MRPLGIVLALMYFIMVTPALYSCPLNPVAVGKVFSGPLYPGISIVFSGDDSYDLDNFNYGSHEKWRWYFNYQSLPSQYVESLSPYTAHQYSSPGSYLVALIYFDNDGQSSAIDTFRVVVGLPEQTVVVRQRYEYDTGGRLLITYERNNEESEVLVSQLEYNELGQVTKKKLHGVGGTNFLQTLDYTYNERGWLQICTDAMRLIRLKPGCKAICYVYKAMVRRS